VTGMTVVQSQTSYKHASKRYEPKDVHPTVILHFTLKPSHLELRYFLITPDKSLSTQKEAN
jgi:hypothetical protein